MNRAHQHLFNIVLHHHSMTAIPLFEIMRALVAENLKIALYAPQKEVECVNAVLKQAHEEMQYLSAMRNAILHGTWFIGSSGSQDKNFSNFLAMKFKITKSGLTRHELPDSIETFDELSQRCSSLRHFINCLNIAFIEEPGKPRARFNFRKRDGKWLSERSA